VPSNDAKTNYQEMQKQIAQFFVTNSTSITVIPLFSDEKIWHLEMVLALPLHGKWNPVNSGGRLSWLNCQFTSTC